MSMDNIEILFNTLYKHKVQPRDVTVGPFHINISHFNTSPLFTLTFWRCAFPFQHCSTNAITVMPFFTATCFLFCHHFQWLKCCHICNLSSQHFTFQRITSIGECWPGSTSHRCLIFTYEYKKQHQPMYVQSHTHTKHFRFVYANSTSAFFKKLSIRLTRKTFVGT